MNKEMVFMRRKDREITDFNEIMAIIDKCDTCRLALFDQYKDDESYNCLSIKRIGYDRKEEK